MKECQWYAIFSINSTLSFQSFSRADAFRISYLVTFGCQGPNVHNYVSRIHSIIIVFVWKRQSNFLFALCLAVRFCTANEAPTNLHPFYLSKMNIKGTSLRHKRVPSTAHTHAKRDTVNTGTSAAHNKLNAPIQIMRYYCVSDADWLKRNIAKHTRTTATIVAMGALCAMREYVRSMFQ